MTKKNACCQVEAVTTVDERGQMVLPKEIREKAQIKAGDKLALITWKKEYLMALRALPILILISIGLFAVGLYYSFCFYSLARHWRMHLQCSAPGLPACHLKRYFIVGVDDAKHMGARQGVRKSFDRPGQDHASGDPPVLFWQTAASAQTPSCRDHKNCCIVVYFHNHSAARPD